MLPRPNESVIFRALSDGAILFSTVEEAYFGLNGVAAEIWQHLLSSGDQTVDSLCSRLSSRYPEIPQDTLCTDVVELIESLTALGLLIPAEGAVHDAHHHGAAVEARLA